MHGVRPSQWRSPVGSGSDAGKAESRVTQHAVERTIGKLVTDAAFRAKFFSNPASATWQAGLTLSPVELEALSRLSSAALARFGESLDARIRRLWVDGPTTSQSGPIDGAEGQPT
jgi:hypothetical protein